MILEYIQIVLSELNLSVFDVLLILFVFLTCLLVLYHLAQISTRWLAFAILKIISYPLRRVWKILFNKLNL